MSEALGSVTESVAGSGLGVVKPNPGSYWSVVFSAPNPASLPAAGIRTLIPLPTDRRRLCRGSG